MTYKEFLFRNGLPDCMGSYREYLEKHNNLFHAMPDKMKQQTVFVTYKYRFCPSAGL